MDTLNKILAHVGFEPRPQQSALSEALLGTDEVGVVVQAGTGTGKSIGVLSAAYDWSQKTGRPTLVVCPTNILLDQYLGVDAPRVSEALGCTIRALKGRNRYLCSNAPGFSGMGRLPDDVIGMEVEMNQRLHEPDVFEPRDTYWFGCPGSDECPPDDDTVCHYRRARGMLSDADIIVTNAHLLIIDNQLKGMPPVERTNDDGEVTSYQPSIFPKLGAVFVDEAHTLEDSLRSFATRSIPQKAVEGFQLEGWMNEMKRSHRDAVAVTPGVKMGGFLREVATQPQQDEDGRPLKKYQREAREAAAYILQRGADLAYNDNEAVLFFDPQKPPLKPKLTSTQINLAGGARRLLTAQPFGLVSGTVPKTMRGALGISEARMVDVGHPFDYSKQVELKVSGWSGSFQASKNQQVVDKRIAEVVAEVEESGGGALLLFSSYKDMEMVYERTAGRFSDLGLDVRMQEREGDNRQLGFWFKGHGNAVLFGTSSFATGFDVPGNALRLVVIWKLPYPGLDPVTKAISARSRARYEDMMLMSVTQAAGRLIRTSSDTGRIFIADERAEGALLNRNDPMIEHFNEMRVPPRQPVSQRQEEMY